MSKKGKLLQCYYLSTGQMLTQNQFFISFTVNGGEYSISVPNNGWSYRTPALQFMGYIEKKPTDFDGWSFRPEEDIELPVVWNEEKEQWFLQNRIFQEGQKKLKEVEWFNPSGTVWDGGTTKGFGGMSVDPNSGNKSEVEIEE